MPAGVTGLYVARLDLAQPHLAGVARKIEAQRGALADLGFPTRLLCIANGAIALDGKVLVPAGGSTARRINHHMRFHRALARAASQAEFLYIRYQGAPPDFIAALRRYKSAQPAGKVLLELPSWPFATERRGWRQKLAGGLGDSGLKGLAGLVDRIVTFSQAEEILGVPTLRTDNGVDVQALPLAPQDPQRDATLRLAGVANLSFWHGYDRVIAGIAEYRANGGKAPVEFTVVGTGEELPRLKAQAAAAGLDQDVRFTGPMHGEALDALLAGCDVGVSSIGMHRLDVDTSNLKSREFCARGIPFLIAYPDRDFPERLPFVMHLPATDAPVDIGAVATWVSRLREDTPDLRQAMRAYAEQNLTWQAKLAGVAGWLEG